MRKSAVEAMHEMAEEIRHGCACWKGFLPNPLTEASKPGHELDWWCPTCGAIWWWVPAMDGHVKAEQRPIDLRHPEAFFRAKKGGP